MDASVLILSGGLDSTVSAFMAREQTRLRQALFFDYGQQACAREREAAETIARILEVPLQCIALPWLKGLGASCLTDRSKPIPVLESDQLDNREHAEQTAQAVWVPNRNGIFLNVAAAFAESLEAKLLVTGFNAEEAVTFPDNSEAFVRVAGRFFQYATQNGVAVISYTQDLNKSEIVRVGLQLSVPFESVWSCYTEGPKQCGQCESCRRSIRAYQRAGVWERMKERFRSS